MMMCAIGYRRRRIVPISCTTAPTSEVTTPIFRGNARSNRFRAASNNPSAASFLRVFWYAAQNAPTPAGVAALMRIWTDPRRGNTSTSPETTTSMPSSRSKPRISASSRNRVHEIWAVASFRVKNTWPAGARWRLLTSPRTRIRERIGFARTVSRITRASWATVSACGVRPQPVDGDSKGAAGRDDVFDEQHAVPAVQLPLEVFLRPVLLRGFPHHEERLPAREAHRGGDRHGAELDPRDPVGTACVRRHGGPDHTEELGSRDCPLDIDVIRGRLARRQRERPEPEGAARLERGHEGGPVDLTTAHASCRSGIRGGSRPDAGRA